MPGRQKLVMGKFVEPKYIRYTAAIRFFPFDNEDVPSTAMLMSFFRRG